MNTSPRNIPSAEDRTSEVGASGQLRAMDSSDEMLPGEDSVAKRRRGAVRRGAVYGGWIGVLFGAAALLASVIIGVAVGALIGKATELRIEKGSAPRIHFSKAAERKAQQAA